MRSIGIDIGTYSIKVAEIEASARTISLIDCFEVALDPDPSRDTRVQIVEVLRQIAERYDPSRYRFVFSLPQAQVSMRQKQFPFRERHKILRSLPFELEEDIPFTQETAIFEAKILHFRRNSAEVLALACPKTYVQAILDMARDGQLDPDVVTFEAEGLACLTEDIMSPPTEGELHHSDVEAEASQDVQFHSTLAHIHLHMGHQHTVMAVFHMGTLIWAKTIYWGGLQLAKAVQKQYNLPFIEALKGLTEKGFVLTNLEGATKEQAQFSNSLAAPLQALTEEVKRSLLDVQSEFRVKFDRIDFSGGVSRLINLGPYLTQAFELPANFAPPLQNIDRNAANVSDELLHRAGLAIGLAIEGGRRPTNPAVNFRKNELAKENLTFKLIWARWKFAAQLAAAGFALFFVYSFMRESFATDLSVKASDALKAKAQEYGLKKGQTGPTQVQRYVKEKQREIRTKKTLAELQDINSALDVMNRLNQVIPAKEQADLDVRRFYLLNEYLTIEGEVSRKDHLDRVQSSIRSLAIDRQVKDLTPSFAPAKGRLAFAYSLKVNRRGAR